MRNISEEVKNRLLRGLIHWTCIEIQAFSSIKHMKDYYERPDAFCGTDVLHNLRFGKGIEDKFTLSDATGNVDAQFVADESIIPTPKGVYQRILYNGLNDGDILFGVMGYYSPKKNLFYAKYIHELDPTVKNKGYKPILLRRELPSLA